MVPVDSRGVSRAPRYSGTRAGVRSAFTYVAITLYGRLFQVVRLAAGLLTPGSEPARALQPPALLIGSLDHRVIEPLNDTDQIRPSMTHSLNHPMAQ